MIGDFGPFKSPAWYYPESPCNIVSFGRAVADGARRYRDEYWDEDVVEVNGERFHFTRRGEDSMT